MKRFLYILSAFVLILSIIGCRSKEDRANARVMANKERIIEILRSTGRPGIDTVISHLEASDFFTRPGGGHHTEPGGLAQHSLEVYRIMRLIAWFQPSDRIAVTALLHDMGKIENGGWHPWLSVKLLGEWGFELSEEEYIVILRHHRNQLHYFRSPLRRALSAADAISTGWWKLWHRAS
ncbi:MAG: HD domain-containing protein [Bacteroidales bacterium]|nr:HD domain-containing protein [Bacteroidales bacterium]